ncbi:helix-turn-helix domain-containing protein [Deinococcus yunweiensis]|uniref:helix-turn-helix domain-containing protein n=1 Tax=Deinococcus yunweiensis TaxID=367282 RepID=UPI00398E8EF9
MTMTPDAMAELITEKVAERLELSLRDEILKLPEAAALLRLHPSTIRNMANRGELPGFKFGDSWRFRRSALLNHVSRTSAYG